MNKHLVFPLFFAALMTACAQAPVATEAASHSAFNKNLSLFGGNTLPTRRGWMDALEGSVNVPSAARGALETQQRNALPLYVDPEALAAARRLQAAEHVEESVIKIFDMRTDRLKQSILAANPGAEAATAVMVEETFADRLRRAIPGLLDIYAQEYAKRFTAAELDATTAFYETPLGVKWTTMLPAIDQAVSRQITPMIAQVLLEALKDLKLKAPSHGMHVPQDI